MFFIVDYRNFMRASAKVRDKETAHEDWKLGGLYNMVFLGVIIGAVFINNPPFLREALMIGAALASYFLTGKHNHEANHFSLGPIKEVAILFIGIFGTMMPALDWLQANAGHLQQTTPGLFYWGSGVLSSVLDNAPTYLCFLNGAFGRFVHPEVVSQVAQLVQSHGAGLASLTGPHADAVRQTFAALKQFHPADVAAGHASIEEIKTAFLLADSKLSLYIVAVSVGSVFFGANTYIGNGPNFLVKAIADHQKVHTPSFGGYIFKYTLPYMLPMLLIVWLLFFH
jgi:Na+/H+ antiporter NhaD/arsenite permease-like protein